MKRLKVRLHSVIDVITNSSTELFCNVRGSSKKAIRDVLEKIVDDLGCKAVDFDVDEAYEERAGKEVLLKDVFMITYDYECYHEPCKHMLDKIKEVFEVVEVE